MVLATHHIGIAVDDLDAAVETYAPSARCGGRASRPARASRASTPSSMRGGTGRIELLAPLGAETPVGRFLAKRGPGLHHIAFQVADVGAELERLRQAGTRLIDETPAAGSSGWRSRSSIRRQPAAFWQSS